MSDRPSSPFSTATSVPVAPPPLPINHWYPSMITVSFSGMLYLANKRIMAATIEIAARLSGPISCPSVPAHICFAGPLTSFLSE